MIRLDRKLVKPPADWEKTVDKALPDSKAFDREAAKFQKLGLNSKQRRDGFSEFAPQVLPKRSGKPHFPTVWGKAKEALAQMSHHKCAYCEGEINAERSGQVEHFKPKALFPSLAYDWDNYFLACGGCNGAKSDKWPSKGAYLRPDQGDPSKELSFESDGTVKPVHKGGDAEQTIQDFDLNRKWLVRLRAKHLVFVLAALKAYITVYKADKKTGLALVRSQWGQLQDPAHAYSAALTQCFLREWNSAGPGVRL